MRFAFFGDTGTSGRIFDETNPLPLCVSFSFTGLIDQHYKSYAWLDNKKDKSAISMGIVNIILKNGCFAKKGDRKGTFYQVQSIEAARVKVAQALQYRLRSDPEVRAIVSQPPPIFVRPETSLSHLQQCGWHEEEVNTASFLATMGRTQIDAYHNVENTYVAVSASDEKRKRDHAEAAAKRKKMASDRYAAKRSAAIAEVEGELMKRERLAAQQQQTEVQRMHAAQAIWAPTWAVPNEQQQFNGQQY